MRVLFDHPLPFSLAHGGLAIQIRQTRDALAAVGVEADWMRWWDESQAANVIHYFGRPDPAYIDFAHRKGCKVVMSELLTGLGSRTAMARRVQRLVISGAKAFVPPSFLSRMAWGAYQTADACVALTPWEARLMREMFDAPPDRVHVIPNGVEDVFLSGATVPREKWLVCTATITERKRVLELAQAAVKAQVPLRVVGKPYSETDGYGRRFIELVRANPGVLRYEGAVADRAVVADVYLRSRGFVLLSTMESLSLSALEAAACGCPLLLSDLPWARCSFGDEAAYCQVTDTVKTAAVLKAFYEAAPKRPVPARPHSWRDVGVKLKLLYEVLLRTSK
ncbi:MAG TPA: glycosyltransferase family 4 protein [Roseimicrobium sp.]|nr:glycosyltransferase family 4 protein [Roseimicrobium sp.]